MQKKLQNFNKILSLWLFHKILAYEKIITNIDIALVLL
jgi:hypothetical protein